MDDGSKSKMDGGSSVVDRWKDHNLCRESMAKRMNSVFQPKTMLMENELLSNTMFLRTKDSTNLKVDFIKKVE